MASLTFTTGVTAGTSDFVRVGHNSSGTNNDAVWEFTPTAATSVATFVLKWNNSEAGTGWAGSYQYVFGISVQGGEGRLAHDRDTKALVTLSGSSGTATVKFTGLSLSANTKYYLRANFNGTTNQTMKAFYKTGNTCTLSASAVNLIYNGEAVTKVVFNGQTVSSLIYNGTKIF